METLDILKIVLTQAVITIFALIVGYIKLRQDIHSSVTQLARTRKLDRLEHQLADFYGPLHMLAASNERAYQTAWGTDVWTKVFSDVLIPNQQEMEKILVSNLHLVEENPIPESYLDFLNHVRLVRFYKDRGLDFSYFEKEVPYPEQFNKDIAMGYDNRRGEYLAFLGGTKL
jgi:hypothetical protein